jgi:DNA-binding CsgD family transcriptional regulator
VGFSEIRHNLARIPLSAYFGFAVLWIIWLMIFLEASFSSIALGNKAAFVVFQNVNYFTRLAMIIALLSAYLLRKRLVNLCRLPLYRVLSVSVFPMGIFISYFLFGIVSDGMDNPALLIIGGCLESVGFTLLLIPWILKLGGLAQKSACLIIMGAFFIGVMGYYGVTLLAMLSRLGEGVVYLLLPACSLYCLLRGAPIDSSSCGLVPKPEEAQISLRMNALAFTVVIISSTVYGYIQFIVHSSVQNNSFLVKMLSFLITLTSAIIIILIVGRDPTKSLRNVYKIALPIILIGFLLLPFSAGNWTLFPTIVIFTGYAWFTLCAMMMATVANRLIRVPFVPTILLLFMAEGIGNMLGSFLSTLLFPLVSADNTWFYEVTLVLFALMFFAVGLLFELLLSKTWSSLENTGIPPSHTQFDENAAFLCIAEQYALSAREEEVFLLLARGKRADEIAATLVISVGTTRNHIHNIYEKLGVGSYKSMMQLIREVDSSS